MTSAPRAASNPCTSNDTEPALPYPPTRLPAIALLLLLGAAAAGCGDDSGEATTGEDTGPGGGAAETIATAAVTGAGGAAPNGPPTLTGGTELVLDGPIREGIELDATVAIVDPEDDPFTTVLSTEAFVDGTLEGDELVLHVGYRAEADIPTDEAGEALGSILARDEAGAESTIAIRGLVKPLGWGDTVEWGSSGPEAREHGTFLVDDASGSIYMMFGSGYSPYLEPLGDAWRFDVASRTWSEVELDGDIPGPGGSKRLGGVRGSGEGWLYGGYGEDRDVYGDVHHVVADGDVLHFEEIAQENPPGERLLHVFAYDPGSETFALFGGASTVLEGDTWTMQLVDGVATWTEIIPKDGTAPHPTARYGAFSGMDEALGRLTVFSGQTSSGNQFGQDTWVLDFRAEGGPAWTDVTPAEGPPGRRNGTSAWDPSGSRLFVFGGTSDGATTQPGLFAFDARPGRESWSQVERAGEPPLRSSGFGVFAEDAVWMGFGNGSDGVYPDLTRLGY